MVKAIQKAKGKSQKSKSLWPIVCRMARASTRAILCLVFAICDLRFAICLLFCLSLVTRHSSLPFAQQPQAQQGQPLYAVNAKYVNGVAPGYWPTAGSGLTLNLSAGTANCGGIVTYSGGTLTMTASATNYVYLNMSSSCAPGVNTTGFGSNIPIATVVTGASAITSITDMRTMFFSSVGVNGAAVPDGLPSTGTNGLGQIVPGSLLGNNSSVFDCTLQSGADFSVKVNACIAAVIAAGGGTADARGFPSTNTMSVSIIVGDGTHPVTLLLPSGTITRAVGAQLIYNVSSSVVGAKGPNILATGGTILQGSAGDSGAAVYPATPSTSYELYGAEIKNLQIRGASPYVAGSIGLEIGGTVAGHKTDVLASRFENITTSSVDIGVQMNGPNGCTCYNAMYGNVVFGHSYGLQITNTSGYPHSVNSNNWFGGIFGGLVGIYEDGDSNKYYSPDLEGCATHGIEFAGYNATVYGPYEEANGPDVFDYGANYNAVMNPNSISFGYYNPTDNSGGATNFWWGPAAAPKSIGVMNDVFFSTHNMFNDGSNVMADLHWTYTGTYNYLDLLGVGYLQSSYGHYGHTGFRAGTIAALSGLAAQGKSTISSISNPSTPTLAIGGSTGSASASYAVVGHDLNGGVTLPSSFASTSSAPNSLGSLNTCTPHSGSIGTGYAPGDTPAVVQSGASGGTCAVATVDGNGGVLTFSPIVGTSDGTLYSNASSLSTTGGSGQNLKVDITTNYVAVTWNAVDGLYQWDILKNNNTASLATSQHPAIATGATTITYNDTGQATAGYTPPTRNTTGDETIAGNLNLTSRPGAIPIKSCTVIIGDPGAASSVLANDNSRPSACSNDWGSNWTITAVSCWANAGSPTVTPILTSGSSTSILTGALTCGTGSWAAGTVQSSAPVVYPFNSDGATCPSTPCTVDVNMTTAGGIAKYIVVKVVGTL